MPVIQMIKGHNHSLKPANPEAERVLDKVKFNDQLSCKITLPRNPLFHRKFFGLMHLVFQNQEQYTNFDRFRNELVMRAGFWEKHVHLTGNVSYVAQSLAYESMDEATFSDLYNKVAEVIMQYFWQDMTKAGIEEAVMDFITDYAP